MENNSFLIEPVAHIYTGFSEKFGIPRQSGLVKELPGRIVFEKKYRRPEAVRGLEKFSHIWIIWRFDNEIPSDFRPTVRPPRLWGNERMGVFATRSPFRPNGLGLSCVKLDAIDITEKEAPVIYVSGVDMLDGTPIIDIKPYIPVADLHPEATEGYTEQTKEHLLDVVFENGTERSIPREIIPAVEGILRNDPRPGYAEDPAKIYGILYSGFNISFTSDGKTVFVKKAEKV
jgi:tRNA-Thr(GGU) m(6)t(6)A37 methyltransferase TsaA